MAENDEGIWSTTKNWLKESVGIGADDDTEGAESDGSDGVWETAKQWIAGATGVGPDEVSSEGTARTPDGIAETGGALQDSGDDMGEILENAIADDPNIGNGMAKESLPREEVAMAYPVEGIDKFEDMVGNVEETIDDGSREDWLTLPGSMLRETGEALQDFGDGMGEIMENAIADDPNIGDGMAKEVFEAFMAVTGEAAEMAAEVTGELSGTVIKRVGSIAESYGEAVERGAKAVENVLDDPVDSAIEMAGVVKEVGEMGLDAAIMVPEAIARGTYEVGEGFVAIGGEVVEGVAEIGWETGKAVVDAGGDVIDGAIDLVMPDPTEEWTLGGNETYATTPRTAHFSVQPFEDPLPVPSMPSESPLGGTPSGASMEADDELSDYDGVPMVSTPDGPMRADYMVAEPTEDYESLPEDDLGQRMSVADDAFDELAAGDSE